MNFAKVRICLFFVLLAATSCSDDDQDTTPQGDCLLTQKTVVSSGKLDAIITYTSKSTFTYQYDDAGYLTMESTVTDYTYSNGETAHSEFSAVYQYDGDGHVLQRTTQDKYNYSDGTTGSIFASKTFTYKDGRAVQQDIAIAYSNGDSDNYALYYSYDANGRLIKFVNGQSNAVTQYEYSGDYISRATTLSGYETAIGFEYNSKGLLIKATPSDGNERRYEYNAEGQVIREEEYENGQAVSATVHEYDDKRNPEIYESAVSKGVPVLPGVQPEFISKHNTTRLAYFERKATNTDWVTVSDTRYTYEYNSQAYPILRGEGSDRTTTLEYNCQ